MVEYTQQRGEIARQVKNYAEETGDATFLDKLLAESVAKDDRFSQAIVRYLMHKKRWNMTDPTFIATLEKFFTNDIREPKPKVYVTETNEIIKAYFDYDMP